MHTPFAILLSKPGPSRGSLHFTLFLQRLVHSTCPTPLSSRTYPVSSKNHAARHHALLSSRPFIFPPAAPCCRTPFTWQTKIHTHTQQQPIERSAHAACILLPCCQQWIPASVFCKCLSSVLLSKPESSISLKASVTVVAVLRLGAHWLYCEVSVLVWHDAASLSFLCGMTLHHFRSCAAWRCVTT
jgi:hypothetical protein